MTLRWRIYYGDGSVFDPGDPFQAPALNVQMVANGDRDHGWSLVRQVDYYWYDESIDEWNGGDIFGLWDYLQLPGHKKVVFGRNTTNANFNTIFQRALNDPDIPQKTGWRPRERESAGVT
jgi:hypothetical protein